MFEHFAQASGFIFDCDGCLLDSMPTWRRVEYKLIEMTGHNWTQAEIEEMRAAPLPEAARIFHERHHIFGSAQEIAEFVDATMLDYYRAKATPRLGADEFLKRLHAANIPCCIVSSSPLEYVDMGLKTAGMRDYVGAIFSTQEEEISKQDPRIWKRALDSMGAQAKSAWGADDSLYAIRVMNECGISTIGTYNGDDAGTFEELVEHANIAIHEFTELLD